MIVTGGKCTLRWSIVLSNLALHFGDFDGDDLVDYVCMELNGMVTGWLNKTNSLDIQGQIKFSKSRERASHEWADVNGDGKADIFIVDVHTGEVLV